MPEDKGQIPDIFKVIKIGQSPSYLGPNYYTIILESYGGEIWKAEIYPSSQYYGYWEEIIKDKDCIGKSYIGIIILDSDKHTINPVSVPKKVEVYCEL